MSNVASFSPGSTTARLAVIGVALGGGVATAATVVTGDNVIVLVNRNLEGAN